MTTKTRQDIDAEREVGEGVRAARLRIDIDQATLAQRANVSLSTLKNLEAGRGSSLLTLARVLHALGRDDVLGAIRASDAGLRPGSRYASQVERKRASRRR